MYLKELLNSYVDKKIKIYIDMDGVVADYRFGEGKNIELTNGTIVNPSSGDSYVQYKYTIASIRQDSECLSLLTDL